MKADFMILSDIQKDIWQDFFIFVKNQDLTLWGGGVHTLDLNHGKNLFFICFKMQLKNKSAANSLKSILSFFRKIPIRKKENPLNIQHKQRV